MWRKGNPCPVCRDVNWYSYYKKQHSGSSKNLKIELLYDLEVQFLGIYPKEMKTLA